MNLPFEPNFNYWTAVPHWDGTAVLGALSGCLYGKGRPCKSASMPSLPLAQGYLMALLGCLLLFYSFTLFTSKKPNSFLQSMSLLKVQISQLRKLQGEELKWKACARPNINTVKSIDIFFSDLLPLQLLRMKGQVHPWCEGICFGFCWERTWCSGSTVPVARHSVQEEGTCLQLGTGTNQGLLSTHMRQQPARKVSQESQFHEFPPQLASLGSRRMS